MSGECDSCGSHCTDCRCDRNRDCIKIWAQMFFEDGSVTRGIRIPADWLDEGYEQHIAKVADDLLHDVNREDGWLLLWGAGNMEFFHYPTSSSSEPSELDSSA